ncbi:MAG: riboflavin biosynthesis protein RibF [Thermoguttaceae bacterium]|nr:riboflavin biosynthesis protein RibF [Thermoguttaceae bacterium]
MEIFNRLDNLPLRYRGGVLSIGKFDGLHLGHARIMACATETARRLGAPSIVFTFSPAPARLLRPETASEPLTDPDDKRALIEAAGVDALVEFPTTLRFLSQTADEFFSRVVVEKLGAVGMVEGKGFSFGRDCEGTERRLRELAERRHIELTIVPSVAIAGTIVSSSVIREALRNGDVALAAKMLGRRYRVRGVVGRGDMRGRTLGFPTANLTGTKVFLPGDALYAAIARTSDGIARPAAINLGGNPTFGVEKRKIETHILDFCGNLYDKPLELEFCAKIRDVVKFPDKETLLAQMNCDVKKTRELVQRALS